MSDGPVPSEPSLDLLDVGKILRPHGLRGHVVVELWTNRQERMSPGTRLDAGFGNLEVVTATVLPEGASGSRWLVSFKAVTDHQGAEALRGTVLRARPIEVEGALWVHRLIGAEVVDEAGENVGSVASVQANPASDLLVLDDGRLIPLTFVTADDTGRLTVSGPPGLLDL